MQATRAPAGRDQRRAMILAWVRERRVQNQLELQELLSTRGIEEIGRASCRERV